MQETADLVTFREGILNGKLHFLCSDAISINPIQHGERKGSPISFSPAVSTYVGTRPQNFLTFSFSPFATLM